MSTQIAHPANALTAKQHVQADEVGNEVYAAHYSERRIAKIALGTLAALSLVLTGALVHVANRPALTRYVRIDDAGRAQAIQYSDLNYSPREGEIRTYLTDWLNYRHTINRETIAKKYPMNYYFLSSQLASQLITEDNNNHLTTQVMNGQIEQGDVQVNNVTITMLIRADLQAQGRLSPDSISVTVHAEQKLTNPKLAAQYTPGDLIQYRRGSPILEGIAHNSMGVVLGSDEKKNLLTIQTSTGDEAIYSPHMTKTMTQESTVYRVEQREIAIGERLKFTEAGPEHGICKGDFGTVTKISGDNDLQVRLDKGISVQLKSDEARHIEHGYSVENLKAGTSERVLITQEAAVNEAEIASLSRNVREVSLYTSDGSASTPTLKRSIALPDQQQIKSVSNVATPEPTRIEHRRSVSR